jgi:predicted unusual protein kinase regulating ubiquinone biosynthesis (AarF/ABC1/UbiB family)
MANWTGCRLSGVDGQNIPEPYLQPNGKEGYDTIQDTCQAIGMDCSSFVFFHADLGPSNIIVADDSRSGRLGIIDFEISGFFSAGVGKDQVSDLFGVRSVLCGDRHTNVLEVRSSESARKKRI